MSFGILPNENGSVSLMVGGVERILINADGTLSVNNSPTAGDISNKVPSMDMFDYSMSANGYQVLPSGMIVQWINGAVHTGVETAGSFVLNFPITFPNSCIIATASTKGNNTTLSDTMFQVSSFDATSVTLFPQWFGTGTQGLCAPLVIAIGY